MSIAFGVCLMQALPAQAQSKLQSGPNLSATSRLLGESSMDDVDGRRRPGPGASTRDQFGVNSPRGASDEVGISDGADDLEDALDEPLYKDFSRNIRSTSGKVVLDALPIKRSEGRAPKLPDTYLLGSGDQIEVQAWGAISAQYHLTIDEGGRVFIPDVGSIPVAGVKANDLAQVLTGHFKRLYKGFELRAMVSHARAITVYVAGQANSVGLKNVSASHTLLSATLGFARPSDGGSRRFITFQRGKESPKTYDLYCFFREACPVLPEVLSDGDVIRVPARGKLVAISGAVSRPGIYELAEGETIQDLLKYSGGTTVTADLQRVYFYSFGEKNSLVRQFKLIDISEKCVSGILANTCKVMNDGDYFDIQNKYSLIRGAVTISSPGVGPFKIEYKQGLRLLDAVSGVVDKLVPERLIQHLNAGGSDTLSAVDEKLRRLDLDSITLYRWDSSVREYQVNRVSYAEAKGNPNGRDNVELLDGDILSIDEVGDFKTRRDQMVSSVQVIGEVNKPGRYRVLGAKSLGDAFEMAGGLSEDAAPWGAVVLRKGVGKTAVNREVLDRAFTALQEYQGRQEKMETGQQATSVQMRALGDRGTQSAIGALNSSIKNKVGDLMEGRDIVYLHQGSGTGSEINSMALQPSDIVLVPPQQDTFACYGAVFKPGDFYVGLRGSLSTREAVNRCGLIDEMSGSVYQFVARESRVCRKGWLNTCPDIRGGDMIVVVPESITKQGASVAQQWLDVTLRSLTALATIKVLAK